MNTDLTIPEGFTHLDNGFYVISRQRALSKAGSSKLPRDGHELLVVYEGRHWWLARTRHLGGRVWSMRQTAWRLRDGLAVLGPFIREETRP
jgi:hypothetical protein